MPEIQKMSKISGVKSIVQKKQEAAGAYCMVYEKIHGSDCHDCQPGRLSVGELHRAMWKKSVAVVKCVFIKRTRTLKMWFYYDGVLRHASR